MTRICVFGAGGVGGYLAATLARAGRDVAVVARGAHLDRIRSAGLTIRSAEGEWTVAVPASDRIDDLGQFDAVVVTAKAPALTDVARALAPHLGRDTAVLFATNGVQWFYGDGFAPGGVAPPTGRLDPDGILHRLVGVERSFGVIVRSSNVVVEPGIVLNAGGGRYELGGALSGHEHQSERLAAALDVPGTAAAAVPDIRRAMWRKVIRNAAVALLCGLTHATPGQAFGGAGTAPLARGVMEEVLAIAAAHGFADLLDLGAEMETVAGMTAMKPSIVQDLELGRMVELDAQVLILVDFAQAAGLQAPLLKTLAPVLEQKARLAGCFR